ncbi:hypothetical protein H5410_003636 [Solanum commersonii]|uniref:Uncharacterized protein n=1 Tax=Solanum commersonii TaxID=4109 RepID=A0A9J6B664_SOLCO|nr:hypothetical protein H5410_003636 [Solanum commersonii]
MGGFKKIASLRDLMGSLEITVFMNLAPEIKVHHLIRQGLDHTPLHVKCNSDQEPVSMPFKFLNFWTKHVEFKKEVQFEIAPTEVNKDELSKDNTELKRYMKMEEEVWKKRSGMRWFTDGERNTKFFHAYVKRRRRKLNIKEITTRLGKLLTHLKILERKQ